MPFVVRGIRFLVRGVPFVVRGHPCPLIRTTGVASWSAGIPARLSGRRALPAYLDDRRCPKDHCFVTAEMRARMPADHIGAIRHVAI